MRPQTAKAIKLASDIKFMQDKSIDFAGNAMIAPAASFAPNNFMPNNIVPNNIIADICCQHFFENAAKLATEHTLS